MDPSTQDALAVMSFMVSIGVGMLIVCMVKLCIELNRIADALEKKNEKANDDVAK